MKVCKDSMMVTKSIKRKGVHNFFGETLIGKLSMAVAPEDQKVMSEKELQIRTEQKLLGKKKVSKVDFFEHCIFEKQHRLKFKMETHESKTILQYVHADLWGLEYFQLIELTSISFPLLMIILGKYGFI